MYRPGYNRLLAQPLGVVGVVAPWNYPYQLSMLPAVAALAAGNRVMIKPSELAPRTAELMARIVGETFDEDELAVFPGDATVGKAFVELPFDHLFFTGSTAVGRIVAQAAAKNLTPVTLELGGKSPVIVDAEGHVRVDRAENRHRQAVQCRPDLHRAGLRAGAPCPHRRIRRCDDASDRQALPDARRQRRLHEHRQRAALCAARGPAGRRQDARRTRGRGQSRPWKRSRPRRASSRLR